MRYKSFRRRRIVATCCSKEQFGGQAAARAAATTIIRCARLSIELNALDLVFSADLASSHQARRYALVVVNIVDASSL